MVASVAEPEFLRAGTRRALSAPKIRMYALLMEIFMQTCIFVLVYRNKLKDIRLSS